MILKWFRTKDVDDFPDSLVADMLRRFPPAGVEATERKANEKLQKTHRAIFSRVEAFAKSTDLNVYRTARLGNRVKWSLAEASYRKPFADAFTHELVALSTIAAKAKRKNVNK